MSSAQQQKTSSGLITMIHKSRKIILELLKEQTKESGEQKKQEKLQSLNVNKEQKKLYEKMYF